MKTHRLDAQNCGKGRGSLRRPRQQASLMSIFGHFSGESDLGHGPNQEPQLAEASGSTMGWIKSRNCGD